MLSTGLFPNAKGPYPFVAISDTKGLAHDCGIDWVDKYLFAERFDIKPRKTTYWSFDKPTRWTMGWGKLARSRQFSDPAIYEYSPTRHDPYIERTDRDGK